MANRGGNRSRAGHFEPQVGNFKAFIPAPLPPAPPLVVDETLLCMLAEAERAIGRLDSFAMQIANPDRFVYMYIRKEAVLSSQIEGTQASLSDLLSFEASENTAERTVDLNEVLNYLRALQTGLDELHKLPISSRLLCSVHRALMKGVRGGEASKTPGELRRSQNWIGGASPANATFVPPPPPTMQVAMGHLERYLNDTEKRVPLLIEIALAHAQFETIHPFIDGNGRIGRLLVTFLLAARGALSKPLLYLSYYLKKNREEYYTRLQGVRMQGDWEGWVSFFVRGVAQVAAEATARAREIVATQERDRSVVRKKFGQRAASALALLDHLMDRPIASSRSARTAIGRSQPTVDKLLREFVNLGMLREVTGQSWGRVFAYDKYLALFEVNEK